MPQLPNLTGPAVPPEQAAGIRVGVPSNSGLQAIAQAVGMVGEEILDAKVKILDRQNKLDILDNESAYGRHMASHQQKLDVNNPVSWIDETKKASDNFIDGLSRKNLAPEALDSIKMRIANYESKMLQGVARDAQLAQVQILSGEFQNRQTALLQNRDFDGAARNLEESALDLGLRDDEVEAGRMKIEDQERIAEYEDQVVSGNSEYFENDLPALSKSDRASYKRKAETRKAELESSDIDKISGAMAIGAIKTKNDLVKNLEAAPNVSSKMARKVLANWENSKPLSYEEKRKITDTLNDLHDQYSKGKISRDEYGKKHHNIAAEVYAMGKREGVGGLRSRLYALDPTKWSDGNLKLSKAEDIDQKIEKMVSAWDGAGGFGKPKRGEDQLSPQKALEVQAARELTEMSMKEWAKTDEGRNATPDQIRKEFMNQAIDAMTQDIIEEELDYSNSLNSILEGSGNTILPK
jgi:hypothetical protein